MGLLALEPVQCHLEIAGRPLYTERSALGLAQYLRAILGSLLVMGLLALEPVQYRQESVAWLGLGTQVFVEKLVLSRCLGTEAVGPRYLERFL